MSESSTNAGFNLLGTFPGQACVENSHANGGAGAAPYALPAIIHWRHGTNNIFASHRRVSFFSSSCRSHELECLQPDHAGPLLGQGPREGVGAQL